MSKHSNEIVEVYKGVNIRRHPIIMFRVSIYEMKKFIDAKVEYKLSAKEAIKSRRVLCPECKDASFKKFNS